jgi:hypothetical protein
MDISSIAVPTDRGTAEGGKLWYLEELRVVTTEHIHRL